MTKKNDKIDSNDAMKALMEKVIKIKDRGGKSIQVLPMEGEAATEALAKLSEKYPNIDTSKGIVTAVREKKRLVFAMCTINPTEAIGWTRTSDLFQCNLGPTARAARPRKGKSGAQSKMLDALAAELGD